jgi:hypothetical protein
MPSGLVLKTMNLVHQTVLQAATDDYRPEDRPAEGRYAGYLAKTAREIPLMLIETTS